MHDDLPDDVLLELGRLTWSAIRLEDLTVSLCRVVHPANPREDRRPIGQMIKEARRALRSWPDDSEAARRANAWLARAAEAIERRNALLHSVPLVILDSRDAAIGHALGEMPRGSRKYFERHLSVPALREVRNELLAAQQDWRETILLASGDST